MPGSRWPSTPRPRDARFATDTAAGWDGKNCCACLEDRAFVRYPCDLVFDAGPLLPGEFACPLPKGSRPEDGFVMHVHPLFQRDLDEVPLLVLYQLVSVNYGDFASAQDAEAFGAAALGLDREEYYAAVCRLADRLEAGPAREIPQGSGGPAR